MENEQLPEYSTPIVIEESRGTKVKLIFGIIAVTILVVVVAITAFSATDTGKLLNIFQTNETEKQTEELTEKDKLSFAEENRNTFVLEKLFPNLGHFKFKVDPEDANIFWIKKYNGLVSVDTSSGVVTDYDIDTAKNSIQIGDFIRVRNQLMFDTNSGIGILDMNTRNLTVYSQADGLVDENNIRLHPDPYDEYIIWISTFRGLSKFDLQTRTFKNFTSEMGIAGSQWQPRIFYIDEESVWVSIGAHAYSRGGIARLTKDTNEWTSWSTESFVQGETENKRVDALYLTVGGTSHIVIEEDNVEYRFDQLTEEWIPLRVYESGDPIKSGKVMSGEWLYYTEKDVLKGYNIITKEEVTTDYVALYNKATNQQSPISYTSFNIGYDNVHDRYLVYVEPTLSEENTFVLTFQLNQTEVENVQIKSLKPYFDRFSYVNTNVLDFDGRELLFREQSKIVLYDIIAKEEILSWDTENLLQGAIGLDAKLYKGEIGFNIANYCEGMCRNPSPYVATTTIVDRSTGDVIVQVPFHSDLSYLNVYWGDSADDVALYSRQEISSTTVFSLDINAAQYIETAKDIELPESSYHDYGEYVKFEHPDLKQPVYYLERAKIEDYKSYKIRVPNDKMYEIPLSQEYWAFGPVNNYHTYSVHYLNPNIWFATDRGLIRFNPETGISDIYTNEDGLLSKEIKELYIGDRFIINDGSGLQIFRFNDN